MSRMTLIAAESIKQLERKMNVSTNMRYFAPIVMQRRRTLDKDHVEEPVILKNIQGPFILSVIFLLIASSRHILEIQKWKIIYCERSTCPFFFVLLSRQIISQYNDFNIQTITNWIKTNTSINCMKMELKHKPK